MTLQLPAFVGVPEVNRVYQVDALTLLRAMPEKSVDAIISDPPYNMTELAFEQAIDWQAFWLQAQRILKTPNCPTVLFSQQPFTTDLINSNRKGWRYEIIWEKSLAMGFLDANKRPLRAHENIQIFADAQANYSPQMESQTDIRSSARRRAVDNQTAHYDTHGGNLYQDNGSRYPRSVWKFAQRHTAFGSTESLHPTAKPIPLMEKLIATYTEEGALIVDPFAGSGSTAAAAYNFWVHNDFLLADALPCFDLVIGNPPYNRAEQFVKHSLAMLEDGGYIIQLLRLNFLEGQARGRGIHKRHPPQKVIVCAGRVSFTGDGKSNATAYAYFIWQKGWQGKPSLEWSLAA